MQCNLREHLCFSPHAPLPWKESSDGSGLSSGLWNLDPRRLVETQVSDVQFSEDGGWLHPVIGSAGWVRIGGQRNVVDKGILLREDRGRQAFRLR
jgi:hypothetical protein